MSYRRSFQSRAAAIASSSWTPVVMTLLGVACTAAAAREVALAAGPDRPFPLGPVLAVAAGGAAVTLLLAGLAGLQIHARGQAESARRRADSLRAAAQESQAAAEAARTSAESARDLAERAGRVKDEFLATLSHELRTPLNAILGWAQLLRRGQAVPPDVDHGLSVIERNAKAQVRIVADLLDVSRMVCGRLHLDVRAVDLGAAALAAVESARPAAAAKNITLDFVGRRGDAAVVRGDPLRLQQVAWNLVSNAVKFTPPGGRVRVAVARSGDRVRLSVADTGEGIDPAFLPHVFDRFVQADASTARRHGGLGLGLAIVRHLVELHGGTVRARSAGPGTGSTFTLELPASGADVAAAADAAASADPSHAAALAGLTVLAVDDDEDARDLARRVLAAAGATVLVAAGADEAIDLLAKRLPDVLVGDVGMPGVNGLAMLRSIRALPAAAGGTTPAVALSAFAAEADRARALDAGFDDHLGKPAEAADLVAAVARLAGRGPTATAATSAHAPAAAAAAPPAPEPAPVGVGPTRRQRLGLDPTDDPA